MTRDLATVTVGAPTPLNGPVHLRAYDPAWPECYGIEEARVRLALGATALAVHHVGSTSVPGLSAKPIIDMVLTVADSADETCYVPALEQAGYSLRIREPDWFQHRLLRRIDPAVNLHVFSNGCEEVDRMLAFRDRLRSDADARQLYELTKQRLAVQNWAYTQDYADAKTGVVQAILSNTSLTGVSDQERA